MKAKVKGVIYIGNWEGSKSREQIGWESRGGW